MEDRDKTAAAMREAGLAEEEIEHFKEAPVNTLGKLLNQGKRVPICFQDRVYIVWLERDMLALEVRIDGLKRSEGR